MTFNETEKLEMLAYSRRVLENKIKENKEIDEDATDSNYMQSAGVFVTLKKGDELRGCIGYIEPVESIWDAIRINTIAAATGDPRFASVEAEELAEIMIEISILTRPKACEFEEINIGKDGVVLEQGRRKATYLPQVWEDLPEKERFFGTLCEKSGLGADCWKEPQTKFFRYDAIVFGE
jgi:AmmeMemoRadiSam system protein A